ncbi:hypothetical protein B277_01729 [Janibacter hoylei PVAS-1]|uniref:Uncharacterized protein n=1 Tax=Janibacter hoylei PVAS-1 TaxID=1210046 RepID=K1E0Z0_9MICO|nr:hypothetical protein B277_01729 [Janibacter hoylei PVAS-1]
MAEGGGEDGVVERLDPALRTGGRRRAGRAVAGLARPRSVGAGGAGAAAGGTGLLALLGGEVLAGLGAGGALALLGAALVLGDGGRRGLAAGGEPARLLGGGGDLGAGALAELRVGEQVAGLAVRRGG